jgi:transposase InsO family protein
MKIDFSRLGKPTDNAFVESFNGTFRAECLNAHWFGSLAEANRLREGKSLKAIRCFSLQENGTHSSAPREDPNVD